MRPPCEVVELRRYTLHPGARETLIELFDGSLVEPQEAVGLYVLGQFRDRDAPDSFVWLRGFRDMAARKRGLEAFYGGPVWAEHKEAANATMIDNDDVLLLRPTRPDAGVAVESDRRPLPGARNPLPGLVVITVYPLTADAADEFPHFWRHEVEPAMRAAGADIRATYRTEHSTNNYPALPVREGEEVGVVVAAFADESAHAAHEAELAASPRWRATSQAIAERLAGAPHVARLTPTERSLIHA